MLAEDVLSEYRAGYLVASQKALGWAAARRYSRDWLLNQQAKGDMPPKDLEFMDGVSMSPADQRVRLQCCAAPPPDAAPLPDVGRLI